MAETAEVVQTTETSTEQQPSIQELAAFAFNKPTPQQQTEAINGGVAATATEAAPATETTATTETTSQAPDFNAYLKEHFGVDNLETAKTEWQTLQQLKVNPPKAEPFKFENEESEKLARAINTNPKEAFKILEKQERIEAVLASEVTKETAQDIIKLGLQLKYPTLTQPQIDFQYKQEYGIPKEPVMKDTEDEADFNERHKEWKDLVANIEMKATIAATMAKPQIEAAKHKIVLPDIQQSIVDKDYESYKASLQNDLEFEQKTIIPAIQSLTEDKLKISIDVNDANNQMQFGVSISPDKADLDAAKQDALSFDKFIGSINYDKDGKFTADNLALSILKLKHFDKYMQSGARQAVNAERKRVIEAETVGGGTQRNFNTQVEPTELDALKQFAFQKTG